MKPIRYKKPPKTTSPDTRKPCGVYLVSNRDERGELTYSFVSLNPHVRWLLNNVHSSNVDCISSLGVVVASCRGKNPIQNLKQQMVDAGA